MQQVLKNIILSFCLCASLSAEGLCSKGKDIFFVNAMADIYCFDSENEYAPYVEICKEKGQSFVEIYKFIEGSKRNFVTILPVKEDTSKEESIRYTGENFSLDIDMTSQRRCERYKSFLFLKHKDLEINKPYLCSIDITQ